MRCSFFRFCGGLVLDHLFPRLTVMHFYSSLGSILSLLGSGDPASETAICEFSVCSESDDSERVVSNPSLTGLWKGCPSIALGQRQGASPDGGSSAGYCPFEERAWDLGRQTSAASTGRRGLAWANSLG
jgi:hypothetical protein